ncbi:hypothetical protein C8Q77DRAFT_513804 [Trametes polyzona]|nr:hypothetical protein C8Q77DRAFT_513804 [Trametes polyzona]
MGQVWDILDVDGMRLVGGSMKLGEFFWEGDFWHVEALRVPASDLKIDELLRGPVNPQRASLLFRLSVELFDAIVTEVFDDNQEISDNYPFLCLAVTCKIALSHTRKRILECHRRTYSPLALHRLICLGEYTRVLPQGMLNADEIQEILEFCEKQRERYGPEECAPPGQVDLSSFAREYYLECREGLREYRRRSKADELSPMDASLLAAVASGYFPKDQPWALCNVTNREYIREAAAVDLCRGLPVPKDTMDPPELWHFILATICWSQDSSIALQTSKKDAKKLAQGRWAGGRLAIVLQDRMDEEAGSGPAWTDVTDEVGALVKRLWKRYCREA